MTTTYVTDELDARAGHCLVDLRAVHAFVVVAEAGSYVAAGRRLVMDETTVRRLMKALERDLGCALVRRTPTGVALTERGTALLRRCQSLLHNALSLRDRGHDSG